MKKILVIMLAMVLTLVTSACMVSNKNNEEIGIVTNENITVTLNGNELVFDQEPIARHEDALVPFRPFLKAMGVNAFLDPVGFSAIQFSINCIKDDTYVRLECMYGEFAEDGNDWWEMTKTTDFENFIPIEMELSPIIYNGIPFIPVRVLAEAFGGKVSWDDATKTIAIKGDTSGFLLPDEEREAVENFTWADAAAKAEAAGYKLDDNIEHREMAKYDSYSKYFEYFSTDGMIIVRPYGTIDQ